MCVCTITPQQMELDLAHTLKTPPPASDNLMFIPTVEEFKAAVEMTLRDSEWFGEMVESITTEFAENAIGDEIDDNLRRHFRNLDISEHIDLESAIENAVDNYDLDDKFDRKIERYMDNNFDPEDYVDKAVTDYMDRRVDVEEIANNEVHDILNDTDFIHALALAIVDVRKQQAAERKAKRDQLNQGDTNASLY